MHHTDLSVPVGVPGLELREGIRIHGLSAGAEEVELCPGTILGVDCPPERRYALGARVPAGQWRPATAAESERLLANGAQKFLPGSEIGLLRLPPALREQLTTPTSGLVDDFDHATRHAAAVGREVSARLLPFVRTLRDASSQVHSMGIAVQHPDDPTVTCDPRTQERIGLHLDSWERVPLTARDASMNRVGINLGREPRWLLFINLPVSLLAREHADDAAARQGRGFPAVFFERYPTYPLVRVRVDPGCGYIGPTENMIHDGSTSGSRHPGAALFFRGHFRPPTST